MEVGTKGFLRGNECTWDGEDWRTADGSVATLIALQCPRCLTYMFRDEPDACLGVIQGIAGACCGHGKHLGYINWEDIGVGPEWANGAFVGGR